MGRYWEFSVQNIVGSGYRTRSLDAALWCFYHSESFEEAVLMATHLGDDADTTAAIVEQVAEAYYGVSGIPEGWVSHLAVWTIDFDSTFHIDRGLGGIYTG